MTTILTVDDNDALRYSLTRTLQSEGYEVIEARNGAEAIRMAEQSPDLITLDLNLPDINGFEVCRRLRANPQTAHIPILHISATYVDAKDRVRGLEGGADAYLAEPITGAELLATVGALLRMKQAEREARLQAEEADKARRELRKAHDELDIRVQERTAELARKNEEIRELTGRLLKSQDDEQRRLARELHDSTGQMLAGMRMNLDFMEAQMEGKNRDVETLIAQTQKITDEITRQIRTMSYLLHPPLLNEAGLQSALRWYAEGYAQRSGVQVSLEGDPEFDRLSDDLEIALFRVVQEGLTNIHRHSGSATATIRLAISEGSIRMEIIDAGKGTPHCNGRGPSFAPGVGIMGMQERLRQFGGTFKIMPNETGTTVVVTVPAERSLRTAAE